MPALKDVPPNLASHDVGNGLLGHAEHLGQLVLILVIRVESSDLSHLVGGEFALPMPALRTHVVHVLCVRADKKVAGPAAGAVVALVQNFHAPGDLAVDQRVGQPVGGPSSVADLEVSIPIGIAGTGPKPARIRTRTENHPIPKLHDDQLAAARKRTGYSSVLWGGSVRDLLSANGAGNSLGRRHLNPSTGLGAQVGAGAAIPGSDRLIIALSGGL